MSISTWRYGKLSNVNETVFRQVKHHYYKFHPLSDDILPWTSFTPFIAIGIFTGYMFINVFSKGQHMGAIVLSHFFSAGIGFLLYDALAIVVAAQYFTKTSEQSVLELGIDAGMLYFMPMNKNPVVQARIDRSLAISQLIIRWVKKDRQTTGNEIVNMVLPEQKLKIIR